jgi:hypothetical protein
LTERQYVFIETDHKIKSGSAHEFRIDAINSLTCSDKQQMIFKAACHFFYNDEHKFLIKWPNRKVRHFEDNF